MIKISFPKLAFIFLVILFVVGAAYASLTIRQSEEEAPSSIDISDDISDWKTYRSEKFGFEVKYPPTWNVVDSIIEKADYRSLSVHISNFEYDQKKQYFNFPEEDSTVIWIHAEDLSVNGYEYLRETFQTREKSFTLDGLEATRVTKGEGAVTDYGGVVRTESGIIITTVKNDTFYILELHPLETPYIETFDQILSTFRFTP